MVRRPWKNAGVPRAGDYVSEDKGPSILSPEERKNRKKFISDHLNASSSSEQQLVATRQSMASQASHDINPMILKHVSGNNYLDTTVASDHRTPS